ncbi:MAG: MoxR family ATPase, partial [Planctomycetota bacterium]
AQLDRFLMRIEIGYPDPATESRILASQVESHPVESLAPVLAADEIIAMQAEARRVHVSEEMRQYIVAIVNATREHNEVRHGASPRGSLALMRTAQALCFLDDLAYVTPDSVQEAALATLPHRLIVDRHRLSAGTPRREIIGQILGRVPVPTARGAESSVADGTAGAAAGGHA